MTYSVKCHRQKESTKQVHAVSYPIENKCNQIKGIKK
jgi:hypothetical protein